MADYKVDYKVLCEVVDEVPETAGMGIAVMIAGGGLQTVRQPKKTVGKYIVFQLRPDIVSHSVDDQGGLLDNSQFWEELSGASLSCGGAIISAIGVAGSVALVPETGGLSLTATAMLWGGATASALQCSATLYRVTNVVRGRNDINKSLDVNPKYKVAMYVFDGVGLVGAGGAIKEFATTGRALKSAGASWLDVAMEGGLSRPQRFTFTRSLEADGVTFLADTKRLSNDVISRIVKQRILDLSGAALGIGASATTDGGALHDMAIWIVDRLPNEHHD